MKLDVRRREAERKIIFWQGVSNIIAGLVLVGTIYILMAIGFVAGGAQ